MKRQTTASAAVASSIDAMQQVLYDAGLTKSAGTGPNSSHVSDREDPNNMVPPRMAEFDIQRAELKAAESTVASDSEAYTGGTPEDGSFQGAEVTEVTDEPTETISEVPEETDAGTESPAQVDVNNVEGKSASFNQTVNHMLRTKGAVKTAAELAAFCTGHLDRVIGGMEQQNTTKEAGEVAAVTDFVNAVRQDPRGFMEAKVAAVVSDAYADADLLFDYMVSTQQQAKQANDPLADVDPQMLEALAEADAADEAADELEGEAIMGEEGMGEALPAEDVAGMEAIAEGAGESPDDAELIAALSAALDAENVAPEELEALEATSMDEQLPPEEKMARLGVISKWAGAVNLYRNDVRLGRVSEKRASAGRIKMTYDISQRLAGMKNIIGRR